MQTRQEKRKKWFDQYRLWLDDCLVEFNQKHGEKRLYHQDNCVVDYEPAQLVEFGQDGNAYPHGRGGTNVIYGAVTPWEQSKHFME